MKVGTLRFVVVALITGLLTVAGSTTAWAQDGCGLTAPDYSSDFNLNQQCLTLNPNPGTTPQFVPVGNHNVLRLTINAPNQTGSAWFNSKQPVQNGFSTTFQFQFTNPSSTTPADGIAFVIQNSNLNAIGFTGGNGGAMGYGDHDSDTDLPTSGEGIANSLAIEFDTYQNGWDPPTSHVSRAELRHRKKYLAPWSTLFIGWAHSTLAGPIAAPSLLDGQVHKVTITYIPPPVGCEGSSCVSLHIIVDDSDILPAGISVNLDHLLNLSNGNAYIGFTGATGGQNETQDIVTWTFTPQSKSVVVTTAQTTIPFQNDAYNYTAQLTGGASTTVQITPIPMAPGDCDTLVQANPNFHGAQCFVYNNALGSGSPSAVMFEVTCPQLPNSPECNPLEADLGTQFDVTPGNNPGFDPDNPFPGWLKGKGTDSAHPCTPPSTGSLFASNQISSFLSDRIDPFTKGKSGGTGSCWVATYNQPDEVPPGITITTPAAGSFIAQNALVAADYSCSDPTSSQPSGSPTGPYLTSVPSECTGTVPDGSNIDTSTTGDHSFVVNAADTGLNKNQKTVTYTVVGATDLAILNLAALRAKVNSTLTYAIGVGDLGGATAVGVTVTDTLPAGLTPLSGSGNNVSCSVVNRRLTCTTTPFSCSVAGQTVSCPLGPITPLSLSSLNGATLKIKATVTATAGTVLKNTATVSAARMLIRVREQLLNRQHPGDRRTKERPAEETKRAPANAALVLLLSCGS